jgi:late competence protein required for DNA uptake (superfamily II DNA/RNA helicase)
MCKEEKHYCQDCNAEVPADELTDVYGAYLCDECVMEGDYDIEEE